MDPIVEKFTNELFIDQTIDLRNTGDIDELLTRLEFPSGLITKIKNSLTFQESFFTTTRYDHTCTVYIINNYE